MSKIEKNILGEEIEVEEFEPKECPKCGEMVSMANIKGTYFCDCGEKFE